MTSDFVQIDKKKDQKCNEPQYDIVFVNSPNYSSTTEAALL